MKTCPICKSKYPDDANFCPLETCATANGPQRLESVPDAPEPRFKPIERIGGGSTGEVWRARDSQTGTEVALKLVNSAVPGSAATQSRAEREFKQLMRVGSPRVATIIDCGRLPDERLYVAMELVPGESLASVLRAGPVDLETAKTLVGQVGQALLEAQKAGLVHRDVSPGNVLVGPTGDVKVINFPLAPPVTEKVAGDPAYVSPEQAQGKPADQRSNTYSLAAIFYHLLTGEAAFQAATPQAVLDMHVSTPVLPPSQRRPDAGISVEADRLILKAMDKSSSRRHLTLRLFLTELEGVKAAIPSSGAAKPAGGDVGLAKTMLFAGNQAEVSRMVADAKAANAARPASGERPAPARIETVATRPAPKAPAASADPAIPVMDTMAAEPAPPAAPVRPARAKPVVVAVAPAAQPAAPRVASPAPKPAPAVQQASSAQRSATPVPSGGAIKPAEAGKAPPPKSGAAFRETLWFKKGDVEQMVADAKAKQVAAGKPADEAELPTDDARPLEDRYVDDGSVTTEDRRKFSLRTGGTATALPAAVAAIPGEKMNERELVQEIGRSRRMAILLVAAVVLVALAVVVAMMMKGRAGKNVPPTRTFPPAAAAPSAPSTAAAPPAPAAVPVAPTIPTTTAATSPVRAAAPTPTAPEKRPAAAGLGVAKPISGGAVSGAGQEAASNKQPARPKAPHRGKGGKKRH
jgi:serine/threonine-protein kinase